MSEDVQVEVPPYHYMKYWVVERMSLDGLKDEVNYRFQRGWELVGGLVFIPEDDKSPATFMQAMCLNERAEATKALGREIAQSIFPSSQLPPS